MAIYVTGDIHGDISRLRLLPCTFTQADILLIAGDFGLPWWNPQIGKSWNDKIALNRLAELPYTIAFIDGNHDNHPLLNTFPEKTWQGGLVHEIRPNVLHLQRGEIYDLAGASFFCFGGARSIDKDYRIPGVSWWSTEQYSSEQYQNALDHLDKVNFSVDYVLTHTAPEKFIYPKCRQLKIDWERRMPDPTMNMLSDLEKRLEYKKWFFGHFHLDWHNDSQKCIGLYYSVEKIL